MGISKGRSVTVSPRKGLGGSSKMGFSNDTPDDTKKDRRQPHRTAADAIYPSKDKKRLKPSLDLRTGEERLSDFGGGVDHKVMGLKEPPTTSTTPTDSTTEGSSQYLGFQPGQEKLGAGSTMPEGKIMGMGGAKPASTEPANTNTETAQAPAKTQYSKEELQARLDAVRKARKRARAEGKALTPESQEEIFRKELPKEFHKKQANLARKLEDIKKKDKKNAETPTELTDDDIKSDILKHEKLLNRQNQLSEKQRQEEYPEPIKPLDQYKTADELHAAIAKYLTNEEKEKIKQLKIVKGTKTIFEKQAEDGTKYEIVKVSNNEALAEAAKGSHWCVQDPDTAEGYLGDTEGGAFYILMKDGKPFVAIRKNAENIDFIKKNAGAAAGNPGDVQAFHFVDEDLVSGKGFSGVKDGIHMSEADLAMIKESIEKIGFGNPHLTLEDRLHIYNGNETDPLYLFNEALEQAIQKEKEENPYGLVNDDNDFFESESSYYQDLLKTTRIELDGQALAKLHDFDPKTAKEYIEDNKIKTDQLTLSVDGKTMSFPEYQKLREMQRWRKHREFFENAMHKASFDKDYSMLDEAVDIYINRAEDSTNDYNASEQLEFQLTDGGRQNIKMPGTGVDVDTINNYVREEIAPKLEQAKDFYQADLSISQIRLILMSDSSAANGLFTLVKRDIKNPIDPRLTEDTKERLTRVLSEMVDVVGTKTTYDEKEFIAERLEQYMTITGTKLDQVPESWQKLITEERKRLGDRAYSDSDWAEWADRLGD